VALDLALADWVQSAHAPLADAGEEISMHLVFSSLNWPVDNRPRQASRLQINSNQEVGIEHMSSISSYTQGQGTLVRTLTRLTLEPCLKWSDRAEPSRVAMLSFQRVRAESFVIKEL
jgi:hypothetical protein